MLSCDNWNCLILPELLKSSSLGGLSHDNHQSRIVAAAAAVVAAAEDVRCHEMTTTAKQSSNG